MSETETVMCVRSTKRGPRPPHVHALVTKVIGGFEVSTSACPTGPNGTAGREIFAGKESDLTCPRCRVILGLAH